MRERKVNNNTLGLILNEFPMLPSLAAAAVLFTLLVFIFSGGKSNPTPGSVTPDPLPSASADDRLPPVDSDETGHTGETPDTVPAETEASQTETAEATEAPSSGFMEVDESYFADALFIGDSRTDGLSLYCPVGEAKHYSAACMTIFDVMDSTETFYGYYGLRALLQNMQFGKVYIMLGINECGYPNESFMRAFRNAVEEIRRYQPNAIIYLQSILYVTQQHAIEIPIFESDIIKEKNDLIKELANGTDIFYLEVNDALNDGTDHLPSEYTGDGVHLKASYYHLWKDYLLANAWVDEDHPWTPSSVEN